MKQKVLLTDEVVAQLPVGVTNDIELTNFSVRVSLKGKRSFYIYYRTHDGIQRRPCLGHSPSMTVSNARRLAREKFYQVSMGLDPSLHKQQGTVPPTRLVGSSLRRRVIQEQDGKCARCKLATWQGQAIPLELEHKNGIRTDDRRENVEALCCNCHALTDTWRGRNKVAPMCPRRFRRVVLRSPTVAAALKELGLANSGYWYARARRLK